ASKPERKIVQAMRSLGNQNAHPCSLIGDGSAARHTEFFSGHGRKRLRNLADCLFGSRLGPFNALEKNILFGISVLVSVKYVSADLVNPARNLGYKTRPVRAVEERNDRNRLHLAPWE